MERVASDSPRMVIVKWPGGLNGENFFHGLDWHRTKEAAVKRAEAMRDAKIKALRKRIAELSDLTFS